MNLNKTTTFPATNSSGGDLNEGDVVVLDAAQQSFTTTTDSGFSDGMVGVIIEPSGIADGASGKIATGGFVKKINLSAAASFLDLVKTHSVAGQGFAHAYPRVEGDFAQVLDESDSPPAFLFGSPTPPQSSLVIGVLGLVEISADQNSISSLVDITSATLTFDTIAGHYYRVSALVPVLRNTSNGNITLRITDGSNNLIREHTISLASAFATVFPILDVWLEGSGGSITRKLRGSAATNSFNVLGTTQPWLFVAEDLGVAL